MSSNRNYIKLKYTEYGYEIYVINGGKKIKLNQKDKMIMRMVLNKFYCEQVDDFTYIYPKYGLITLYFSREKNKAKPKKVNRNKSKKILTGVLILLIASTAYAIKNGYLPINIGDVESTGISLFKDEQKPEVDDSDMLVVSYDNLPLYNNPDNVEFLSDSNETIPETINETIPEIEDCFEFCYEFDNPNDKDALINAEEYMDVFYKYEKMYGVDAQLLCAIGAQESSGVHHSSSVNGGYATGIMGIEYIWANGEIRVFNFETNSYEIIVVDYSRIGELDYNVKIGAAIFQNYFYHTLKNSGSIEEYEYLPFTIQKYNMGPGNMRKVLKCGENWIDNRCMINAGDKYYFEHVLSRLDNGTVIRIRLDDGSYYETRIINTSLVNTHSRT